VPLQAHKAHIFDQTTLHEPQANRHHRSSLSYAARLNRQHRACHISFSRSSARVACPSAAGTAADAATLPPVSSMSPSSAALTHKHRGRISARGRQARSHIL